jgi:hypothetical protein
MKNIARLALFVLFVFYAVVFYETPEVFVVSILVTILSAWYGLLAFFALFSNDVGVRRGARVLLTISVFVNCAGAFFVILSSNILLFIVGLIFIIPITLLFTWLLVSAYPDFYSHG